MFRVVSGLSSIARHEHKFTAVSSKERYEMLNEHLPSASGKWEKALILPHTSATTTGKDNTCALIHSDL
jgi:hypothetical protein